MNVVLGGYRFSSRARTPLVGTQLHGLVLGSLTEHDWTLFQQFPWLVENASGQFVVPKGRPRIPLSFTLLAHAPSKVEEPLSSSEA